MLERVLVTLSTGSPVDAGGAAAPDSGTATRQVDAFGFSGTGLGPMLSGALCMLYCARSGLTDSELGAGLLSLFPRLLIDDIGALDAYSVEDPRGKRAKMLDSKRTSSQHA